MSTYPDRLTLALLLPIAVLGGSACAPRLPPEATPLSTLARYREALVRDDPKAAYELMAHAAQQSLPYEQFAEQWKQTQPERAAQAAELQKILRGERPPAVGAQSSSRSSASSPAGLPAGSPAGSPARSPAQAPELDRSSGPGSSGPADASAVRARAVVTLPQGSQLVLAPASAAATDRFLAGRPSVWRVLDPDLQIIRAPTPEAALRLLVAAAEQRNYPALLRLLTRAERQSLEAELTERLERLRSTLARGQQLETTFDRARLQYDPRFFIDLRREQDGWRIADFN